MIFHRKRSRLRFVPAVLSVLAGCLAWSVLLTGTPLGPFVLKGNPDVEYKLYDREDPITRYIEDPQYVEKLKNFHTDIQSAPDFSFYEKIRQPLDIEYFSGAEHFAPDRENVNRFRHGQTDYISVNQLLVNGQTFAAENIRLHSGTPFDGTSYSVSQDYRIPVILGSDYLGFFEIGDTITALNYYGVPSQMQVQGFAEKGASVLINGKTILLDDSVLSVSPILDFAPRTADETRLHGLLYFQKINGFCRTGAHANSIALLLQVNRISARDGMFPLYIQGYSEAYQKYVLAAGMLPPAAVAAAAAALLVGALLLRWLFLLQSQADAKGAGFKPYLFCAVQTLGIALPLLVLGKIFSWDSDALISASLLFTLLSLAVLDAAFFVCQKSKHRKEN